MPVLLEGAYFLSILSFLGGLKYLSKPKKAKLGNVIAGIGMILAVCISFISEIYEYRNSTNISIITITLIAGTLVGKVLSKKIKMTQMPQLVSLFNATGGACAVLLVIVEANQVYNFSFLQSLSLIFGAITGAVATPVTAFNKDITTGMSAPPIGETKNTPKANAKMDIATTN